MLKHVVQYLLLIAGFLSLPFLFYFAVVTFNDVEAKDERGVPEASASDSSVASVATPSVVRSMRDEDSEGHEVLDIDEVGSVFWLKRRDNGMYETVSNLGWVADGIDDMEEEPVEVLIELGLDDPGLAIQYIEMPWFGDGLTEDEGSAFLGLTYIDYYVAEVGNLVGQLPWVVDGITEDEAWAALSVWELGVESPEAANALISKGWFRDGITAEESDALTALSLLSYKTGMAARFVDMPFMRSIEETDALALYSLHQLALLNWHSLATPSEFHLFIAHPTIADGITDEETVLVTLGSSAYEANPDLAVAILEPGGVMLETRSVGLPMAGEVELVIARVEPGPARSMDILESTVRFAEQYMGELFPVGVVLLLYADAVEPGFAGFNLGTNIVILPDFDIDDGSVEADESEFVTMHEVAHFYWNNSSQEWIDEGAANFFMLAYAEDSVGVGINDLLSSGVSAGYECTVDSLDVLEAMDASEVGDCAYKLGLLFFLDLYDAVGAADFQFGYRSLYLLGRDVWDPESPDGRSIDDVMEAFGVAATEEVISGWYGGNR